jgi:Na+/H+ antiporter NhaC
MTRLLGALAALILLGGVFLLPPADEGRLAAAQAAELLDTDFAAKVVEELGEDDGSTWTLSLGQVFGLEDGDELVSRQAVARAFRAAAVDAGRQLNLAGSNSPAAEGVDFQIELHDAEDARVLTLRASGAMGDIDTSGEFTPPAPTSLLPPLVAIALALLFRKPIIALLAGVIAAGCLMRSDAGLLATLNPIAAVGDVGVAFWGQFTDSDKAQVVGFVIAMLAMVGVITHNGGLRGVMDLVAARAKDARRTQIATWIMGLVIFFDDYANTILCGATMRPLTDRFRVSREKLAYLVDSTAAPVAGISIFSTWVAFEVSQYAPQLPAAGMSAADGYSVFIQTIPYRFYCIFALALCGLIAFTGRDFGPMLTAERRARTTGELVRKDGTPMVSDLVTKMTAAPGLAIRAWRAIVPLGIFLLFTVGWVYYTGYVGATDAGLDTSYSSRGLSNILGAGNSYTALLYGSSAGLLVAVTASLAAKLPITGIVKAAISGLRATSVALVILYLAWMIGAACGNLGTATYITAAVGDALPPALLPVLLFALSGLVAFSTGSSWSTMSILLPLVVGLAYQLGLESDLGAAGLVVVSIGAVLEGAIFGDHCSPISDTTVLSSTACASDHIDHVRTQMPYALLAMIVAVVCGYLPVTYLGASPWLCLPVGIATMFAILRLVGERADDNQTATEHLGKA